MPKKILQKNENVLRQTAKEVPIGEIISPKIKKILKEMSEALKGQDDGVAIAAPQIGYSLRIFVVSGKLFNQNFATNREKRFNGEIPMNDIAKVQEQNKDLDFINPKISKLSKEKDWMPEGCLSVRPLYGKTFRSKKATVTAFDENGKKFTRGASG